MLLLFHLFNAHKIVFKIGKFLLLLLLLLHMSTYGFSSSSPGTQKILLGGALVIGYTTEHMDVRQDKVSRVS